MLRHEALAPAFILSTCSSVLRTHARAAAAVAWRDHRATPHPLPTIDRVHLALVARSAERREQGLAREGQRGSVSGWRCTGASEGHNLQHACEALWPCIRRAHCSTRARRTGQKRRTRTSRTMSDVLPMYFSEVQTPPACGPTVGLGTTLRQKVPGRAVRVTSARNVLGR